MAISLSTSIEIGYKLVSTEGGYKVLVKIK